MNAARNSWSEWMPPHPYWDTVLRIIPSHIFIFDANLICRYAAPNGETFLDRPPEHLVGRHAAEVLPPATDGLRFMVEQAAREPSSWTVTGYRYRWPAQQREWIDIWAVHIESLALGAGYGVVVTLHDISEHIWAREQLESDVTQLQSDITRVLTRARKRRQGVLAFREQARTILTPVLGYLQLLARQTAVHPVPPTTTTLAERVLPQLHRLVAIINDLERNAASDPDDTDPDGG
jgi:hypothetical protein